MFQPEELGTKFSSSTKVQATKCLHDLSLLIHQTQTASFTNEKIVFQMPPLFCNPSWSNLPNLCGSLDTIEMQSSEKIILV